MEPTNPTPTAATSRPVTRTGNQPPLQPGPARIKNAQGLEDDDLGPGVIIGSIVVITALLFWMMSDTDDENPYSPPVTGTQ